MPVCSQLLTLRFEGIDFLHRTVQILVTIYTWNCGCFIPLNNIEQTATKTEQPRNRRARQVKVWYRVECVASLSLIHSRSTCTLIRPKELCPDVVVKNFHQSKRNTTSLCTMTACYICRPSVPTCTDTNSGVHREPASDLTASSAVNLPMSNASFRLVVI